LADSLLVSREGKVNFNPFDLRLRFLNWWRFGYNNAFGCDRFGGRESVGLGGNISQSFSEFLQKKTEYTTAGDLNTSGNGSLMRLAPVPVCFHDNLELALDIAYKQSKTTHQGEEAAEACQLVTFLIVSAIQNPTWDLKALLEKLETDFKPKLYSVSCLARSEHEDLSHYTQQEIQSLKLKSEDRDWRWKELGYRFCPSRAREQPGYIGSYAMDGLAMSLHCLFTTSSFEECLLKAANLGGDADTVCAIAGQMAGSVYGVSSIPKTWLDVLQKWDNGGDIALKAFKLFTKSPLKPSSTNSF